jgi:hypothetical protein
MRCEVRFAGMSARNSRLPLIKANDAQAQDSGGQAAYWNGKVAKCG